MSTEELYLNITPLKLSGTSLRTLCKPRALISPLLSPPEIPAEDAIIKAGREVLDSTTAWKQGKTYQKNTVKTFSRSKGPKDGTAWYCRVSEHTKDEATFDEFWGKLGLNKAENEMQCVCLSAGPCPARGALTPLPKVHSRHQESPAHQAHLPHPVRLDPLLHVPAPHNPARLHRGADRVAERGVPQDRVSTRSPALNCVYLTSSSA